MKFSLKDFPDIIRESAQSTLGVLALMLLLLGILAYSFFTKEDAKLKLIVFFMLFLGVVGFAFSIHNTMNLAIDKKDLPKSDTIFQKKTPASISEDSSKKQSIQSKEKPSTQGMLSQRVNKNSDNIDNMYGDGYKKIQFGQSPEKVYSNWKKWKWNNLVKSSFFTGDSVRYGNCSINEMIEQNLLPEKELFLNIKEYNNSVLQVFSQKAGFIKYAIILWGEGCHNNCPENMREDIFRKFALHYNAHVSIETNGDMRFGIHGQKVIVTGKHNKSITVFAIMSRDCPLSEQQGW
jgi:hypothetical protein